MSTVKFAFLKTLPITVSYYFVSIAYGIMLRQLGFNLPFAAFSSAIVFAGAYQFVMLAFLGAGASLITVALTALFVNGRHIFYGITLVDDYRKMGKMLPFMIHTLSDETYSLMCSTEYPEGVDPTRARQLIHFMDWFSWILGTMTGSIMAQVLPFDFSGFDFALSALFITIFIDQWRGNKDHRPALIGLIVGLGCLILFGADNFILPALILASGLLILFRPAIRKKAEEVDS